MSWTLSEYARYLKNKTLFNKTPKDGENFKSFNTETFKKVILQKKTNRMRMLYALLLKKFSSLPKKSQEKSSRKIFINDSLKFLPKLNWKEVAQILIF